jgi:hypothetical protein
MMKKLLLFAAAICLFSVEGLAQTRDRVFDNFDTSKGVQVYVPPPPPAPPVSTKNSSKKLVKKTGQKTAKVEDGLGLKNPPSTPLLIYAQMHQESSFKKRAVSHKGASGLMQLMPATARRFGVTNIFDPKQNIDAGVKYMRWLLDTFNGDMSLALAGYNAGEGAVMKYGWQIPPYSETREYVRRISARYNSIRNPNFVARTAKKVSASEAAKFEQKESAPLTVYELEPMTVRLPDGRMRLVSQ